MVMSSLKWVNQSIILVLCFEIKIANFQYVITASQTLVANTYLSFG